MNFLQKVSSISAALKSETLTEAQKAMLRAADKKYTDNKTNLRNAGVYSLLSILLGGGLTFTPGMQAVGVPLLLSGVAGFAGAECVAQRADAIRVALGKPKLSRE